MELVRFTATVETLVSAQRAFDRVVPRDDSTLFRGYLVLPAVVGVSDVSGPWSVVGQQRTVHLSDGGRFREEITLYDRPPTRTAGGRFDYRVTAFAGLLAHLVSDAEASWEYLPGSSATRGSIIRWTYGYRPLPGRTFVVRHLIGPLWLRYMRRSLAECVRVAEAP
ncbi:MAG: SRPBCC family protein [Herbiconiux sp.]|nr:SRPBCC family protein [Herbiconiux sp.]